MKYQAYPGYKVPGFLSIDGYTTQGTVSLAGIAEVWRSEFYIGYKQPSYRHGLPVSRTQGCVSGLPSLATGFRQSLPK
jgi:hypothetical protein